MTYRAVNRRISLIFEAKIVGALWSRPTSLYVQLSVRTAAAMAARVFDIDITELIARVQIYIQNYFLNKVVSI